MNNKDDRNIVKMIHEILSRAVGSELRDMRDGYGVPQEILDRVAITLYAKDESMKSWKGGKTKFVKIFEKESLMLLKNNKINFNELGFLTFLALSFTNYEDNVLRRKSDGQPCTQKDIIEESGKTRGAISPLMISLVDKKILFEKKSEVSINAKSYFLNPMLFYRGNKINHKQKEILDKIRDEIYAVWKDKDEANKIIEENKLLIDKAVDSLILTEKEIVEYYHRMVMDDIDNSSIEDGIREEINEENID